jgi:hypothetical protein
MFRLKFRRKRCAYYRWGGWVYTFHSSAPSPNNRKVVLFLLRHNTMASWSFLFAGLMTRHFFHRPLVVLTDISMLTIELTLMYKFTVRCCAMSYFTADSGVVRVRPFMPSNFLLSSSRANCASVSPS